MNKLQELLNKCKCGVFVSVNEHRDYYQSAEESLREDNVNVDPEIEKIMIETNTIINIQFYPNTPIGSYSIYHHDLDAALDEALDCFTQK